MEIFYTAQLSLFLFCLIGYCISDEISDSMQNLYLQRVMSAFEKRYESLVMELKSDIRSYKATEATLVSELNKLKHNQKATEAKFAAELNEMKHNHLQDMAEISMLKTELELTKAKVATLKFRKEEYVAEFNKRLNVTTGDTIKPFYAKEVTDVIYKHRDDVTPAIGKEITTEDDAFQRLLHTNNLSLGDTVNSQYDDDKRRKSKSRVNKRLPNNLNGTVANKQVAFFARLSSHTPKLQPGQDIIFNDVLTNIGNGYHKIHGIFVAPVAGVYVFYASLHAYAGQNHARLIKNGQLLAMFDVVESGDTASQMVIIELEAGDDVAVQNVDYSDRVFHGLYYSTFSGFLLYGYPASGIIFVK